MSDVRPEAVTNLPLPPRELFSRERPRIVTVDGQPGSGKSTLSRLLAERLGYKTLTTGMFYCTLAAAATVNKIHLADAVSMRSLIAETSIGYDLSTPGEPLVSVNGVDISGRVFSDANKQGAAAVSSYPIATEHVTPRIVELAQEGAWVFDRGQGVFPDADLKFWLSATPAVRAARRCGQLALEGRYLPYDRVLEGMSERERKDEQSPLYRYGPQADAYSIDTSYLDVEQTYAAALSCLNEAGRAESHTSM